MVRKRRAQIVRNGVAERLQFPVGRFKSPAVRLRTRSSNSAFSTCNCGRRALNLSVGGAQLSWRSLPTQCAASAPVHRVRKISHDEQEVERPQQSRWRCKRAGRWRVSRLHEEQACAAPPPLPCGWRRRAGGSSGQCHHPSARGGARPQSPCPRLVANTALQLLEPL